MLVHNSTKDRNIITVPVDHKGTQVVKLIPGWSEVDDDQWYPREVEALDENEAKSFGKKIVHGASVHAVSRIKAGELKILGEIEVKEGQKTVKRGMTLADVKDPKQAAEIVSDTHDSTLLEKWMIGETRIPVLTAYEERKKKFNAPPVEVV